MLKTLAILISCFLLSVVVRLPNLNRPLSKHHEFCTAVALQVMQVWQEEGIADCHYLPRMNYAGAANKHINNYASGSGKMVDAAGNYYYVSHPPFAYYLPYACFSLLGIYPNVLAIQVFHLVVCFFSGLMVWKIAQLLTPNPAIPYLSVVFYWFSPAVLWFQANTYMADMLVQFFFIWGILAALALLKKGNNWWRITSLCLSIFLMIYTSWLGVFFAFCCFLLFAFHPSDKRWQVPLLIAVSSTLALLLFAVQYAAIAGWDAYLAEMVQRGGQRTIGNAMSINSFVAIISNYVFNYLPLLLLVPFGFRVRGAYWFPFTIIALLPVVLLHFVLTDYSGHDFTTLYAAPFIALLVASNLTQAILKARWVLVLLVLTLSVSQYYYINRPGDFSQSGEAYAAYQGEGEFIAGHSDEDEIVLMLVKPEPQTIFYAHRNIKTVTNKEAAMAFLAERKWQKGILFARDEKGCLVVAEKLSLPQNY